MRFEPVNLEQSLVCPHCDLFMKKLPLTKRQAHKCPRCHSELANDSRTVGSSHKSLLIAAILFYIPANFLPLITLDINGRTQSASLIDGTIMLLNQGQPITAFIVFFCSMLAPAIIIATLFHIFYLAHLSRGRTHRWALKIYFRISDWVMLDVYLVSFCITLFKVKDYGTIDPSWGLAGFVGLTLSLLLLLNYSDKTIMWQRYRDFVLDYQRQL